MNDILISKNKFELINNNKSMKFAHKLNLDKIHRQLIQINFNKYYISIGGKTSKDKKLENSKIPPIVFEYYKYFCITGNIPMIEKLIENYVIKYCNILDENTFSFKKECFKEYNMIFNLKDLYGRICRAYNSYNREIELLCHLIDLSVKQKKEINFYYSFKEDYYNGVDIVAEYKNIRFNICSYTSSIRSKSFKNLKNNNRHSYDNNTIDVISVFNGKDKNIYTLKDVDLYNYYTVNEIINQIEKKIS